MTEDFIRKSVTVAPADYTDDEGNTWHRITIEYKAGPAYGCYLDMDDEADLFLLKRAVDSYIEKYNLTPPEI